MHIGGYWWESQQENGQVGRPNRKRVINIKTDFREIGLGGMD
jgi:hypothetical protein